MKEMVRSLLAVAVLALAACAGACASSGSAGAPGGVACASNAPCGGATKTATSGAEASPIETVWMSRCGRCHVRVEPGTRDHDYLETALKRHRSRVKLDEARWEELVAFLASHPNANANANATNAKALDARSDTN